MPPPRLIRRSSTSAPNAAAAESAANDETNSNQAAYTPPEHVYLPLLRAFSQHVHPSPVPELLSARTSFPAITVGGDQCTGRLKQSQQQRSGHDFSVACMCSPLSVLMCHCLCAVV